MAFNDIINTQLYLTWFDIYEQHSLPQILVKSVTLNIELIIIILQ